MSQPAAAPVAASNPANLSPGQNVENGDGVGSNGILNEKANGPNRQNVSAGGGQPGATGNDGNANTAQGPNGQVKLSRRQRQRRNKKEKLAKERQEAEQSKQEGTPKPKVQSAAPSSGNSDTKTKEATDETGKPSKSKARKMRRQRQKARASEANGSNEVGGTKKEASSASARPAKNETKKTGSKNTSRKGGSKGSNKPKEPVSGTTKSSGKQGGSSSKKPSKPAESTGSSRDKAPLDGEANKSSKQVKPETRKTQQKAVAKAVDPSAVETPTGDSENKGVDPAVVPSVPDESGASNDIIDKGAGATTEKVDASTVPQTETKAASSDITGGAEPSAEEDKMIPSEDTNRAEWEMIEAGKGMPSTQNEKTSEAEKAMPSTQDEKTPEEDKGASLEVTPAKEAEEMVSQERGMEGVQDDINTEAAEDKKSRDVPLAETSYPASDAAKEDKTKGDEKTQISRSAIAYTDDNPTSKKEDCECSGCTIS